MTGAKNKQFVMGVSAPYSEQNNPTEPQANLQKQKWGTLGEGIFRSISFYADYGGCGCYRMIWPEFLINTTTSNVIHGTSMMTTDIKYILNSKAIRIQRQAAPLHVNYFRDIRKILNKAKTDGVNIPLIYEIDDIAISEDIPDYNMGKKDFSTPEIQNNIREIINLSDEMSVTTNYLRDYYLYKLGPREIKVVPNFLPKFIFDRYYDIGLIGKKFDLNKKRPRILYTGGDNHFDHFKKNGGNDDLSAIESLIRKTQDKFKWVFLGGFPRSLTDLISTGKIEYHKWVRVGDFARSCFNLNPTLVIAPLLDNHFNRSKSNIKFLEACAFGIPGVFQDMITYHDAFNKFKTADELHDQISRIVSSHDYYIGQCKKARKFVEKWWLEDNIEIFEKLYRFK